MWRKLLKLRDTAKTLHKMEIKSGKKTSFWYDKWSSLGILSYIFGARGCIDLGIPANATMAEVLDHQRRRRHRVELLNRLEAEICETKAKRRNNEEDIHLWHWKTGFKRKFSSSETWKQIRVARPICECAKGIWFPQATPKHSFITWLAMHNRLSTGDRMVKWNQQVHSACILCPEPMETRNHIFSSCPYSFKIWEQHTKQLLNANFTTEWNQVIRIITSPTLTRDFKLLVRYAFQIAVYTIWRERNNRRHGDSPKPAQQLGKEIDKNIRNRLSLLRGTGKEQYAHLLST